MADLYEEVGRHIRARRRALGLTLEDLEDRSGLSAAYIGQVERNVRKASILSLGLLADALGVKAPALFDPIVKLPDPPISKRIETILSGSTTKEAKIIMTSLKNLARDLKTLRTP